MTDTEQRNTGAVGGAACVWHVLGAALEKLCEARGLVAEAGLEERVDELQEVIDALEIAYAEAESELTEVLLDDREKARKW